MLDGLELSSAFKYATVDREIGQSVGKQGFNIVEESRKHSRAFSMAKIKDH